MPGPPPSRRTPLVTAVAFLTRIPVPAGRAGGEADLARSLAWFPLVGALIGLVVGGVHAVVAQLVTPLVGAALAVTVGAVVTGGFHEDGLGDTADGFGGGWTPQQRLEIMSDPRHGTYGVLAIVCSVVVRVAALSSLSGLDAVVAMAAVHLLARTWAVVALLTTRPARADGLATAASGAGGRVADPGSGPPATRPGVPGPAGLRPGLMLMLAGWSLLALAGLGPVAFGATAAAGAIGAVAVTILARRKVGGLTGDVAGAVEQVAEALGLVAVAGSVAGPGLW